MVHGHKGVAGDTIGVGGYRGGCGCAVGRCPDVAGPGAKGFQVSAPEIVVLGWRRGGEMAQAGIESVVVDTGLPHGVGIADTTRHLGGRCEIEETRCSDGAGFFYAVEGIARG